MTAIEAALINLIDYAGLFPPAAVDMRTAVRNYLCWREQERSWMLGRFIVDIARLEELREAAGDALPAVHLSIIAPSSMEAAVAQRRIREGFRIESLEVKCDEPLRIARLREAMPLGIECYFEIPIGERDTSNIDVMAAVNVRAKVRMGGVVPEAFPVSGDVIERLRVLADRRVPFKATAGLHHPVRSQHLLTYATDGPSGTMHGFINLLCAAAVLYFGGSSDEALELLQEQDPRAFRISPEFISARNRCWTVGQLREVRQFFTSFGSCSFTEPVHDLEVLGWI